MWSPKHPTHSDSCGLVWKHRAALSLFASQTGLLLSSLLLSVLPVFFQTGLRWCGNNPALSTLHLYVPVLLYLHYFSLVHWRELSFHVSVPVTFVKEVLWFCLYWSQCKTRWQILIVKHPIVYMYKDYCLFVVFVCFRMKRTSWWRLMFGCVRWAWSRNKLKLFG